MQLEGIVVVVLVVAVVNVVDTVGPTIICCVVVSVLATVVPPPTPLPRVVVTGVMVVPPCTQMYCRPGVLTAFGQSLETKYVT